MNKPKIDIHMHLAGVGCNCSGCQIFPSFAHRYTYHLLRFVQGITKEQMENSIDSDWSKKISNLISDSELDYGVVLGFDAAFHKNGKIDEKHSQMSIPLNWVFDVCHKYDNLLPGPSIHPYAADALDRLGESIERGAVLIKWLPSAQLINPSEKSLVLFYQKLADAKLPLLVHCSGERTFNSWNEDYNHVSHLVAPLEQGVKVICAHSAARVLGFNQEDMFTDLKKLLKHYSNLWVDNSGMCNPSRFHHLPGLAEDKEIADRTLYGSDWPVPSNAFYYLKNLGLKKVWQLEKMKNWVARDVEIKRQLGYSDETLVRSSNVLANLDKWIG